jgi:hypothetical protein
VRLLEMSGARSLFARRYLQIIDDRVDLTEKGPAELAKYPDNESFHLNPGLSLFVNTYLESAVAGEVSRLIVPSAIVERLEKAHGVTPDKSKSLQRMQVHMHAFVHGGSQCLQVRNTLVSLVTAGKLTKLHQGTPGGKPGEKGRQGSQATYLLLEGQEGWPSHWEQMSAHESLFPSGLYREEAPRRRLLRDEGDRSQMAAYHHGYFMHCTALHCTSLHCTALHCTALPCTALY